MKPVFDVAGAEIVDLMDDGTHLRSALHVLHKKYPEFAIRDENGKPNPNHENFSTWRPKKGQSRDENSFIIALKGPRGACIGLSAFSILPQVRTATLTYLAGANIEVEKRLLAQTNEILDKRNVQAVFIEFQNPSPNAERDNADKELCGGDGLVRIPISYTQPRAINPEDDTVIKGMELWIKFVDPNLSAAQKNTIIENHIEAFIKAYDPEIQIPENQVMLARLCQEIGSLTWSSSRSPAPTITLRGL